MGEYAIRKSDGQEVKIGTCEQMYYLRADQVDKISPLNGNVNAASVKQAESIRFRFPFPQEDSQKPGEFDKHDYSLGLYGIEPPEDIEHYSINFHNSTGLAVSLPCPRSKAGTASPVKVGYNGYSGPVGINSQRLVDGKLALIMACGDCGALYRVPTLEDAKPILDILEKQAQQRDHETRIANERPGAVQCSSQGDYYREVARRIVAGYTEPNFWTRFHKQTMAA